MRASSETPGFSGRFSTADSSESKQDGDGARGEVAVAMALHPQEI